MASQLHAGWKGRAMKSDDDLLRERDEEIRKLQSEVVDAWSAANSNADALLAMEEQLTSTQATAGEAIRLHGEAMDEVERLKHALRLAHDDAEQAEQDAQVLDEIGVQLSRSRDLWQKRARAWKALAKLWRSTANRAIDSKLDELDELIGSGDRRLLLQFIATIQDQEHRGDVANVISAFVPRLGFSEEEVEQMWHENGEMNGRFWNERGITDLDGDAFGEEE